MEIYAKISRNLGILVMVLTPVYFIISLMSLGSVNSSLFFGRMIAVIVNCAFLLWGGWTGIILGEMIDDILCRGEIEADLRKQISDLNKRIKDIEPKG